MHGILRARVFIVQEDCKLLPDRLSFRPDRGLKQLLLSILRKIAPTSSNCSTKGSRNVVERFLRQRGRKEVYVTCVHPKLSQSVQQRLMFRATATARQKICDFGL